MKFILPDKNYKILWGMVAVGVLSLAVGFILSKDRAWLALLSTGYFTLCICLIGFLFAAVQFIAGAKWSVVLRRIPETFIAPLILSVVIIAVVIIAGALHLNHVYEWADPNIVKHDEILQKKHGYLNMPFLIIRLIFYFVTWFLLGKLIRKTSATQDVAKDAATKSKLVKYSVIYTLVFAYSFMLASLDLIMSLQPHWATTMFPVYAFANGWSGAIAAITIILIIVQKYGALQEANKEHLHDMGKWQLMATIFWAYIGFAMHMLTWYANMPEETYLLELRLQGAWKYFTVALWLFHFVVPFLILLSRDLKRTPSRLIKVSWYILFMTFLDVVWLTYGSSLGHEHQIKNIVNFPVGPLEVGLFLGAVGGFGLLFFKSFAKVNPVPTGDIDYETSRHFHQTF